MHHVLARITDFVETQSRGATHYDEYSQRGRKDYKIEHVWPNHADHHTDEFSHPSGFQEYRNRIGGLLLLPKIFNASYGDLRYAEKMHHYLEQNLLARSLHEKVYQHNPGFLRFIKADDLRFQAHSDFKKADLDARQALYQRLAEEIWTPHRLDEAALS